MMPMQQAPLPQQPVTPPGYVVINQDYVMSPFQQQQQQLLLQPHQPPQQNFGYASQTAPTVTPPVTANQCTTPTPAATYNDAANAAQVQSETAQQTVQQTGPENSETQ